MSGFLCQTTAKTNEEYKIVIKKRIKRMVIMTVIGFITAAVGFGAEIYLKTSINEHMLGVYSGVGTGLFAGGIILWIKNRRLLGNEEKLKASRLANTDERNRAIGNKAFRVAAGVMLVAVYATGLIGGLFYQVLVIAFLFIVCIFVIAYLIAFIYYNKKM